MCEKTVTAFSGLDGVYDEQTFTGRLEPLLSASPVNLFTQGACHVFAFALHRHFGYPFSIALNHSGNSPSHVFCRYSASDAYVVDAFGTTPLSARRWELGELDVTPVSPEELHHYFGIGKQSPLFAHKVFWKPAYAIAEARIARFKAFFDGTNRSRTPDAPTSRPVQ